MEKKKGEFVRQQFSSSGLMFLFCAGCGKLVAYSARGDVLTIAERVHTKVCPGPGKATETSTTIPGLDLRLH